MNIEHVSVENSKCCGEYYTPVQNKSTTFPLKNPLKQYFHDLYCRNFCLNLRDAFQPCEAEEYARLWKEKGRDDILEWVDFISLGEDQFVYDIWISPVTGDDVPRCPWLRKLPQKKLY